MECEKLVDYKSGIIKLPFPVLLGFGKRHLNTVELASCLVHVFCTCMTVSKDAKKFLYPLKTL